jgi:hypothetical protein
MPAIRRRSARRESSCRSHSGALAASSTRFEYLKSRTAPTLLAWTSRIARHKLAAMIALLAFQLRSEAACSERRPACPARPRRDACLLRLGFGSLGVGLFGSWELGVGSSVRLQPDLAVASWTCRRREGMAVARQARSSAKDDMSSLPRCLCVSYSFVGSCPPSRVVTRLSDTLRRGLAEARVIFCRAKAEELTRIDPDRSTIRRAGAVAAGTRTRR